MIIYVIIFGLIAFFTVEFEVGSNKSIWPFYVLAIFLMFFAGLRGPDVPKDYLLYQLAFNYMDHPNPTTGDLTTVYEPGFTMIVLLFKQFFTRNYTVALMLFFAICSVTLTAIAIIKYSVNPYMALLFYYSNFFFLHEMTQIRIGLAISIALLAFPFYVKGKFLQYVLLIIGASLFHFSVLALLTVFLFRRDSFSKRWFGLLLILSIPVGLLKLKWFNVLALASSVDTANNKLSTYSNLAASDLLQQANIFNGSNLMNICLTGYLLVVIPVNVLKENKYLSLFLKFNVIAIFLFCIASGNALFAFRVSELFGITSIFLLPYLNSYLPFKKYNTLAVILIAFAIFLINVLAGDLVKPYHLYDRFE